MNLATIVLTLLTAVFMPAAAAMDPEGADGGLRQEGRFPEQSVDADRDGVTDIDDNCPATPANTLLRGKRLRTVVDICGCPIDLCAVDSDKDSVKDCEDVCPATARGLKVTSTGCPRPQKRPQVFVLDVKFKFAEATLQQQSVRDLDQLRVLLLRLPQLTVTLEGHTDAQGPARYNRALSEARARKCRQYLLSDSRIAPERVRAVGYGAARPAARNDAEIGRAQNRRTTATLNYLYEFTPPNTGETLPP